MILTHVIVGFRSKHPNVKSNQFLSSWMNSPPTFKCFRMQVLKLSSEFLVKVLKICLNSWQRSKPAKTNWESRHTVLANQHLKKYFWNSTTTRLKIKVSTSIWKTQCSFLAQNVLQRDVNWRHCLESDCDSLNVTASSCSFSSQCPSFCVSSRSSFKLSCFLRTIPTPRLPSTERPTVISTLFLLWSQN